MKTTGILNIYFYHRVKSVVKIIFLKIYQSNLIGLKNERDLLVFTYLGFL